MHLSFPGYSAIGWYVCVQLEGNPELRDLFSKAGISEADLKEDKEMSKFVMDFLERRGGLDAVKREQREREKARPPPAPPFIPSLPVGQPPLPPPCLLYTSDAADE